MQTLTINKAQVKKLPLDSPFIFEKRYWENCVKESNRIEPVFGSNGFYYDRHCKVTWLEINGEAWLYDSVDGWKFTYVHMANRMHPKVYDAITTLIKWNAASEAQYKAHYVESNLRYWRKIRTDFGTDFSKRGMNKFSSKE